MMLTSNLLCSICYGFWFNINRREPRDTSEPKLNTQQEVEGSKESKEAASTSDEVELNVLYIGDTEPSTVSLSCAMSIPQATR